jgi:hypothetical protein
LYRRLSSDLGPIRDVAANGDECHRTEGLSFSESTVLGKHDGAERVDLCDQCVVDG